MQVLLITVILAGISTMLLRVVLSRNTSSRQTRRTVLSEQAIQSCMAEVNNLWAYKTPQAFRRDLLGIDNGGVPYMYCVEPDLNTGACPNTDGNRRSEYICKFSEGAVGSEDQYLYTVRASFRKEQVPDVANSAEAQFAWKLVYTVEDARAF